MIFYAYLGDRSAVFDKHSHTNEDIFCDPKWKSKEKIMLTNK